MIRLLAVSKAFTERGQTPKVVFCPTSIDLPTDRCVGILAGRGAGKTTLLQMLARNEAPDEGLILAPRAISPVVNSGGLLHPQLTATENVQFLARAYSVDPNWLMATADAFRPIELKFDQPIRTQPQASRRALEAALVTVLPFDCYLYDDVAQFEPQLFDVCFEAAFQRQAGIVFTTANPKLMRRFAEYAVVIDDATLHPFEYVGEADRVFWTKNTLKRGPPAVKSDGPLARRGSGQPVGSRERAPPAIGGPKEVSVWSNVAQHAQMLVEMRRTRRRRFFLHLGLFVGLPTLATAIYMFLIATPRYQSEFEATYQTYLAPRTLSSGIAQSFASTNQNNTVDTGTILYEYIRSPALLEKLDHDLKLRAYYSNSKIDYLSRLHKRAPFGVFLAYYRSHVIVSEGLGGYLTVDVQAFDPKFAQALARAIVVAADSMTDQITARARLDEIKVAEDEVAREEDRVRRSRMALAQFQNQHGAEDPERTATQLGDIVGKMESDLAAARAQLADSQRALSPSSPFVIQLKSQIRGLEQQLHQEQSRLAGNGAGTPYSTLLEKYSALQIEQEFAKSAYLAAQQGLAVARADVARKEAYLVDFAPPNEPDQPSIYFPLFRTLSVFLISLVIYGFGSLVVGAFRDQAGI